MFERSVFSSYLRRLRSAWGVLGLLALAAITIAASAGAQPREVPPDALADQAGPRPNIAIILLDDAGFAATSAYGGLAKTPAFEKLAAGGLRYNRFNVAAVCSPTRAALLSGRSPHLVGFGQIPETAASYPGYDSIWPASAGSLADNLKRMGYGTAAIGKWHNTPAWEWTPVGPFERWPTGLGFDYFYGTMGTTSMWEPLLWRGTVPVDPPATADQGYNLTTDLVDDAIGWIHTRQAVAPDEPYLLYFATTATHSPHHVSREWIAQYEGRFDAGWDTLREEIFSRQKEMGIIPADAALTPRDPSIPAWTSLSADQRRVAARQMEVMAAYMSQTDAEIGRLIDAIREAPGGEDTLIILIAGDNGSSGEDGVLGCDDCPQVTDGPSRLAALDALGGPDHINGSAAGWAFMNNTPFPGMKRQSSDLGGIRVPMIVSWPGHITQRDQVRNQWIDVSDVASTIYDLLGYNPPAELNGVRQLPLSGVSFARSLTSPSAPSSHRVQYFETFGTRSIYRDGWMAALPYYEKAWGPIGQGPDVGADKWELYNLEDDFSQSRDLAARYPDKLAELRELFDREAKRNQVYPSGELHLWFEQMPSRNWNRTDFVFTDDTLPLSWDAVPDFSRAHTITAEVTLPDDRGSGLIISSGMRRRGFALYLDEGRVIYEGARNDGPAIIAAEAPLSQGRHTLEIIVSGAPFGSAEAKHVKLVVDGKKVAKGTMSAGVEPFYGSSVLSIGEPHGSPVSQSRPGRFSGRIGQVRVQVAPPPE